MSRRMLIDATHREETRVVVMEGDRLVEYDYESKFRKPLKGSIFLAKVTRVEPSLQAAFVNFGGNRHGFLPFSEIHPDYFRIPIADREALIAEQEEALKARQEAEEQEEEDLAAEEAETKAPEEEIIEAEEIGKEEAKEPETEEKAEEEPGDVNGNVHEDDADNDANGNIKEDETAEDGNRNERGGRGRGRGRDRGRRGGGRGRGRAAHRGRRDEKYGDDKWNEEDRLRYQLRRKYKIQEVIKRGQIMLVQVSREERGNKGAAVSSYLSLPGRYCVLMPNSTRGGGVSRKIANFKDRARLRDMLKEIETPKGMSVILRTAGVERTKTEIKRDLDYLTKLWNEIRELTLESSAPALVYEEANLIKRAVRDLYSRDIDEIVVSGEGGFNNAKKFMKMMIPSHVKRVKEYKNDKTPLFAQYNVEAQIADIGETQVTLPSGGYLVINPTEALVSIDVNSGKATKERHIEETALKTNLEAATEVARQLRMRDLGGLVVIDFIDMEDRRNNGKVERKLRDALAQDRARIQIGRISSFGLLEMSRQRLNPSLTESQFESCSHCSGTGRVRTADAASILVLRAIEEEGVKKRAAEIIVHVPAAVALYILNYKRSHLDELEERHEFKVIIRVDEAPGAPTCRVEVSKPLGQDDEDEPDNKETPHESRDNQDNKSSGRTRGRRGGRGRGRGRNRGDNDMDEKSQEQSKPAEKEEAKQPEEKPKAEKAEEKPAKSDKAEDSKAEDKKDEKKKPARGRRKAAAKKADEKPADTKVEDKKADEKKSEDKKPAEKADTPEDKKSIKPSNDDAEKKKPAAKDYEKVNQPPDKKKKGWWSRAGK